MRHNGAQTGQTKKKKKLITKRTLILWKHWPAHGLLFLYRKLATLVFLFLLYFDIAIAKFDIFGSKHTQNVLAYAWKFDPAQNMEWTHENFRVMISFDTTVDRWFCVFNRGNGPTTHEIEKTRRFSGKHQYSTWIGNERLEWFETSTFFSLNSAFVDECYDYPLTELKLRRRVFSINSVDSLV